MRRTRPPARPPALDRPVSACDRGQISDDPRWSVGRGSYLSSHMTRVETTNEPYETADWPAISLPKSALVGPVDKLISDFLSLISPDPPQLAFDLSESTYVEVATWQLLLSHIWQRRSLGLITKLRLPAGSAGLRARHALREYRFPNLFPALFNRSLSFHSVVDSADYKYFAGSPSGGDLDNPYRGAIARYEDRYQRYEVRLDARRFFAFKAWLISRGTDKRRFINIERMRWREANPIIIETLNKQLARKSSSVTTATPPVRHDQVLLTCIAVQAITNALRHPNATVFVASSQLQNEKFFTLVYWDDGDSMYATLRHAIDQSLRSTIQQAQERAI